MTVGVAPTPRDTVLRDGTARLYRFRGAERGEGRPVVLLVPSLINRWYVVDLRRGASLAAALVEAGLDVWCLDWGAPEDEDRYLTWDDVVARLGRMRRAVQRRTGAAGVGLLGYCIGGTLAAIHTALEPVGVGALVNLAGPIDFAHAGVLGELVDRRWFDAEALAAAGNLGALQMQSGFVALRPTAQLAKLLLAADAARSPERWEAYEALEAWASDNVAFPAAAYRTYITELYQQNRLVSGEHAVAGRRVDLSRIACPLLTVVTSRDTICPPPAATALNRLAGSGDAEVLEVPGGHVGAVVGRQGVRVLYPELARWLRERLAAGASPAAPAPGAVAPAAG